MNYMEASTHSWSLAKHVLLTLFLLLSATAFAQDRDFSDSEVRVLGAYLAYFGRPADHAGLAYWSDRLDREGAGCAGPMLRSMSRVSISGVGVVSMGMANLPARSGAAAC